MLFRHPMLRSCPYCSLSNSCRSGCPRVIRFGHFRRKSDGRHVQRLRCLGCKRSFSFATFHSCYRQNKRQFNEPLRKLLSSGVSLRRAAMILKLNRITVVRKLLFLASQAKLKNQATLLKFPKSITIEFDEMESFEHTKCKPLSIPIVVEAKSRRILGFKVVRMPAKGKLASIARKKYGPRVDERPQSRRELFKVVRSHINAAAEIRSDMNPHYPKVIQEFFPNCSHMPTKGRRGCVTGQGELKRGGFDPIFTFNHTAAMLRANINRLFRKTWCTTKKPERLAAHIELYVEFHNHTLIQKKSKRA